MIKINSYYKAHKSAYPMLLSKGIDLTIVDSKSPYVLATYNNPDVVIHPLSNIIKGEFPEIRFFGPKCEFPHTEFNFAYGYSSYGIESIAPIDEFTDVIFINTANNPKYISAVENMAKENGLTFGIYGRKYDSSLYYGPIKESIFAYYKSCKIAAVDSVTEALNVLSLRGPRVVAPFMMPFTTNVKGEPHDNNGFELDNFLEINSWEYLFKDILKELINE